MQQSVDRKILLRMLHLIREEEARCSEIPAGVLKIAGLLAEEENNGFPMLYEKFTKVAPWDTPKKDEEWAFLLQSDKKSGKWSPPDFLVGTLDENATNKLRIRESGSNLKGRAISGDTSAMSLISIAEEADMETPDKVHQQQKRRRRDHGGVRDNDNDDDDDRESAELLSVSNGDRCVRFVVTDLIGRINGEPVYLRYATCRNLRFSQEQPTIFQGTRFLFCFSLRYCFLVIAHIIDICCCF